MSKPRIATTSLCGCFGCHMSLLDIDERILELADLVEFDRSPINDLKDFRGRCALGLIEGGCANEENVRVLRDFRRHCDVLISVGDCATMGGLPAMRNTLSPTACPSSSLNLLNQSRSTSIKPNFASLRLARTIARSRRSMNSIRLGRCVSGSW